MCVDGICNTYIYIYIQMRPCGHHNIMCSRMLIRYIYILLHIYI